MRALHTAMVLEAGPAWTPVVFVNTRRSAKERAPSAAATRALFRNMALFLSAPFIGLLYAILLPFVGLGMLAWFAARALVESGKVHKMLRIGTKGVLLAAAPFAGLAYLIVLPFAGLGMLAWFGARAMVAAPVK
jgi:hypothetical protein